jgi:hypothetical protein
MATVNKNFRIKNGLVVEGTTGTINSQNILTETGSDQYILDLVGGANLINSVASGLSVTNSELSIDRTIVDTWYDASGAASSAQTAAESYADGLAVNYDAAGAAATAQSNAEDYADGLAVNYDAAGAAATAQSNAEDYADGLAVNYDPAGTAAGLAGNYDPAGSASTAEDNANTYTDNLIGDLTVDGTSGNTVTARIATAVANLVDSAPAALDTLNELAAALGDNVDGMTGIATAIGNKLPLAGGTMSGNIAMGNNNITGVGTPSANDHAATKGYVDTTASTAQSNAEDYADGLASNYDAAGAAGTAESNANVYAEGLVDAVLDGTSVFAEINVNSEAKQIAATSSGTAVTAGTAYQWAKADFRSGKFLVKIDNGTHNEISEILLTLDSADNIAITEYAIVGTNGSRGTITADISGSNVRIRVAPTDNSTIKVTGTLLK